MVVEKYINNLKEKKQNDKIKKIVDEYNKELDFKLKSPAMTDPSNIYVFCIISILISLAPLYLRDSNISILIGLIYIIPLFIISIVSIICFTKFRKSNCKDIGLFLKTNFFVLLQFIVLCFSSTYMFQFILFNEWESIDYLKSIGLLSILLIPVLIVSIIDAPKKFLKQFSKDNKYTYPGAKVTSIAISLVMVANITQPYMLILIIIYIAILFFVRVFIFEAYKIKKYRYIQELSK